MPKRSPTQPAIHCKSLDEVRANIDRLDRQIVALLGEREAYVRQAARFKKTAATVVVPARVDEVIELVSAQARALGASPAATERIYRAIIDAMTELEVLEHHRLHSDAAPR